MEILSDDPWATLVDLCRDHRARTIDVLTGFLGSGATAALAKLGVTARLVLGLSRPDATLSPGQIAELVALRNAGHKVRWSRGLHAKLYVLPQRAAMIGSANFSRGGFSGLDELVVATTTAALVTAAQRAFDKRWNVAFDLDPAMLVPQAGAAHDDGDGGGIGTIARPRAHGFAVPAPPRGRARDVTPAAPGTRGASHGVLFINIGWHERYDGSSLPTGNHGYLNSARAQVDGSSEDTLFVPRRGRYAGPLGRGAVPDFARLDVVFTAVDKDDPRRERQVVAIFRDCTPFPHDHDPTFMMVRAARDRVTCFPVSDRPRLRTRWPGHMNVRRWAIGGPSANWDELAGDYAELIRVHGD